MQPPPPPCVVVEFAQAKVGGARLIRPAEQPQIGTSSDDDESRAVGVEAEGLGRGLEVPSGPRVGGRARRRREA